MALRTEELAKTIDQTLLDAEAAPTDVEDICRKARELHVASVCVLPVHVSVAAEELRGSDVKTCALIGFPTGEARSRRKLAEAERALGDGAVELEFVMNVEALLSGDARLVRDELVSFARTMRMKSANGGRGAVSLKAVIGTAHLDDKLKKLACKIVEHAEVDFAQTAHGAAGSAATEHDVELLREWLSGSVAVKATGGIDSLDDVFAMVNAGAARIGSARAVQLLRCSPSLARAT